MTQHSETPKSFFDITTRLLFAIEVLSAHRGANIASSCTFYSALDGRYCNGGRAFTREKSASKTLFDMPRQVRALERFPVFGLGESSS